jgi:cell division protein FtsW
MVVRSLGVFQRFREAVGGESGYVACGALIGVSAVVHMSVSLALVPTTGLPLPFISYGRSNLLVSLVAAGVLVSIGRGRAKARRA